MEMDYKKNYGEVMRLCLAIMMTAEQMKGEAPIEKVLAAGMETVLELIKEHIDAEGDKVDS